MSFRTAPPLGTERQEARSSGDGSGKGTSGRAASNVESVLRREVLRLSELMKEKDAMTVELRASLMAREGELKLRDAVIDVLADTRERDRELAISKRDIVLADLLSERATSAALIDELRAKVGSLEASTRSGANIAVPSAPEGEGRIGDWSGWIVGIEDVDGVGGVVEGRVGNWVGWLDTEVGHWVELSAVGWSSRANGGTASDEVLMGDTTLMGGADG
ncbi:hypothetical protein AAC387_Pa06g1979 [Persea americana]